MREMKDSGIEWIGLAPISWDYIAIKYLVKSRLGGSWGNDVVADNDEYNRVCMRIADFDFIKLKFKENENYTIRRYSKQDIEAKTLCYGDLLIEKSGGGEKTPVGRVVVYRLSEKNLYANFMERIRLNEKLCTFEFAKYFFYSLYSQGFTRFYYNQTTGIQNLNIERYFREIKVPLLPLNIQQQIADYLDTQCSKIDATAEDIQKEISLLEDYKKSVITEAVTKGLNPDAEMKDSGIEWIGEIPKDWVTIRIGNVFSLRNERNYLPMEQVQLLSLYSGKGVFPTGEEGTTNSGNHAQTVADYKIVKKNDIVVNIILAWMGSLGISNYNGVVSPAYDVYIPNEEKVVPHYYHYVFRTSGIANECYRYGRGIMMMRWRTYSSEFKRIHVPFPPLEEQQQIADYLDSKCSEIDSLIADKKRQLDILADYKKSLIYEYVTGKKEVPVNE